MMPWSPHVPSPPRQDCGLGPLVSLLSEHGTVASVLTCPFSLTQDCGSFFLISPETKLVGYSDGSRTNTN